MVKMITRNGNLNEMLKGPTIYGIVFVICTWIYWKNNPTGIITLIILCVGDGLADLIGRNFSQSSHRYSWNKKSIIGSLAMFFGGIIFCILYLKLFENCNFFIHYESNNNNEFKVWNNIWKIIFINFICTIVEASGLEYLFLGEDNISVSLTAFILCKLLL
ncbi:hypothetical protein ABK040_010940 [Willaertia magna]